MNKMTDEEVDMMASSSTEDEWNTNCNKVKAVHGGYPVDWYDKMIKSGILGQTVAKWGGSGSINIL